ncbi:MAG TPA: hypothetical protein VL475_15985, partial [Planctomycetaceae bacterium]|nr:hypothetical protein [Planctomycetaceae bacterium]
LAQLVRDGHLLSLLQAGARIHQAGRNGCIGMGQEPVGMGTASYAHRLAARRECRSWRRRLRRWLRV